MPALDYKNTHPLVSAPWTNGIYYCGMDAAILITMSGYGTSHKDVIRPVNIAASDRPGSN